MDERTREFDIVVWGATGFTGRLVAEYLLETQGVGGALRWAIAGRSRVKLESVRTELGDAAKALPIVLGDAHDADSMAALAERTRVVCTSVGPYGKYGAPLVEACARAGTDYCDLAGEVPWIRSMIDTHLDAAVLHGARIVHSCGFDCIPSDLGVYFVQREMRARHGVASRNVKLRVDHFSLVASGGTIASMLDMIEAVRRDPELLRVINSPYSINPKGERTGPDKPEWLAPQYDADFGSWTAPFMMAGVNTKVVRRTNALLDYPYGKDFRYEEAILLGDGAIGFAKAAGVTAGMGGGMALMAIGPLRRLIATRLPAPGEGPSRATREAGYWDIRLRAEHPTDPDKAVYARVRGDGDPGYASSSKMLAESALCLALDPPACEGGFWTPAAGLGEALLTRLETRAGLSFTIEDGPR